MLERSFRGRPMLGARRARGFGGAGAVGGLVLALAAETVHAEVRMPACFGDHMVLQSDRPARLFGSAEPGEEVCVRLRTSSGSERAGSAVAGTDGRWSFALDAQAPGGPWQLVVGAGNELVFEDVWFGEVWLCAGQSNMEWPLADTDGGAEAVAAADDPLLRLFHCERSAVPERQRDVAGEWRVSAPASAASFSALAFHFGRALRASLDRPVGLVVAAWNGTPAEAWIPAERMERDPELRSVFERWKGARFRPGDMFNGMIAPLGLATYRGVLWYQGESNHERAHLYRRLFPELIRSWRDEFADPELWFVYAQMPNVWSTREKPQESSWAELREAQALALALPRTAMAVTIDLGRSNDLHPRNKAQFAERLALEARRAVYGQEIVASGPRMRSVAIGAGEVVVSFEALGGGLVSLDRAPLRGFALAGDDRVFHWASATIRDGTVVVVSDAVPEPRALRYAWADNPGSNLGNAEGLPAAPFRSDDWPLVTAGAR